MKTISSSAPRLLALVLSILLAACGGAGPKTVHLAEESAFDVLFDGSGLEGWEQKGNWFIDRDGVLAREGKGGSIVYTAKPVPDDFELRFEWKVAEGSNSGVYYRPTQYEYQILDNAVHKDGGNARTSAASLYFCMQPSRDATKPVGEWNTARVLCKGTVVQHWLNGEKVVGFDYTDPQWAFNVDLLKKRGGDLAARGGNLSLQDHGDPVWYRNVRIRELDPGEAIDESPVTPATIPADVLAAEQEKLKGIIARREAAAAKAKAAAEAKKAKPKPKPAAAPAPAATPGGKKGGNKPKTGAKPKPKKEAAAR